jgi:hypothetical protein
MNIWIPDVFERFTRQAAAPGRSARNRRNPLQYLFHRRTVRRADPDMMQRHDPVGADEDLSAALVNVPPRMPHLFPFHECLQIGPTGFRPPYIPKGSGEHSVRPVRFPGFVQEERPGERCFFRVNAGKVVIFKRDHGDSRVSAGEFLLVVTQLREVRPARQSAEMAVEYQEKPGSLVVFQRMDAASAVPKSKRGCRPSRQIVHSGVSPSTVSALRILIRDAHMLSAIAPSR